MKSLKRAYFWLKAGAVRVRPEGLWKRYVLGVSLVTLLIFSAHEANNAAIDRGLVDARIINESGRLRMLTQRILLISNELVSTPDEKQDTTELSLAINDFTRIHDELTSLPDLTHELRAAYFSGPLNVDARVNLFLAAARGFLLSYEQSVAMHSAHTTMDALGRDDLLRDLDRVVGMFVDASRDGTVQLRNLQSLILGAAIFVLLLEAMFIYLPAHFTVTSTIANLRKSADTLRSNQLELKRANGELRNAATHDALTKLPNRAFLLDKIGQYIQHGDRTFALIIADVDRFRTINDAAGEAMGDRVLCKVAARLSDILAHDDILARTAGDEFMVLTQNDPEKVTEGICRAMDNPISLSGRKFQTSMSIGYAIWETAQKDTLALVSNAELALKSAKSVGRGHVAKYDNALRHARAQQDILLAELPAALRNGEITPHYQPQVNLIDDSLAGIEVLARWEHPTRGMIPPGDFLPLAMADGLAREVDQVIWTRAMQQFGKWKKQGLDVPRISLNAAPDTIADSRIVPKLMVDMAAYGVDPTDLVIEVLETTFIGSVFDIAAINIDRLIGAGVTVELDDFGTGYASLSKLIQLSLSGIKLDRSLIHPLPSKGAESIVRAMMALATEMELHVVAEGIETDEQAEYLRLIGCDIGQGFGIGKPMSGDAFKSWLLRRNASTAKNAALRA